MTTIYLVMFALGLLYWIIASFIGDHFGEHHLGDSPGDLGHDADHPDGDNNVNVFSARSIFTFCLVGGGMGLITNNLWNLSTWISLLLSMGVGVLGVFVLWKIMVFLIKGSYTDLIREQDYLLTEGSVTLGIPEGGYGKVSISVRGRLVSASAMAEGGVSVPFGTPIEVVDKEADYVVVKPKAALPQPHRN